jgi:ribosomal protein L35AE/L33A
MNLSSQINDLEGKPVIFKYGEDGEELNGTITRIHRKHDAFTAEYYNPSLDAGAGILVKFTDVARVEGNLVVFKK